jgi:hypothetical protein
VFEPDLFAAGLLIINQQGTMNKFFPILSVCMFLVIIILGLLAMSQQRKMAEIVAASQNCQVKNVASDDLSANDAAIPQGMAISETASSSLPDDFSVEDIIAGANEPSPIKKNYFKIDIFDKGYSTQGIISLGASKFLILEINNKGVNPHSFAIGALKVDTGQIAPGTTKKIELSSLPEESTNYGFQIDDGGADLLKGVMPVSK